MARSYEVLTRGVVRLVGRMKCLVRGHRGPWRLFVANNFGGRAFTVVFCPRCGETYLFKPKE